jgi:hypothetical protein
LVQRDKQYRLNQKTTATDISKSVQSFVKKEGTSSSQISSVSQISQKFKQNEKS